MSWDEIVGANVRRFRKAKGLSQEELAGEAGIAMRHIGRIERGENSATVEALGKLASALGVHPSEFLLEMLENSNPL